MNAEGGIHCLNQSRENIIGKHRESNKDKKRVVEKDCMESVQYSKE